MKLAGLQIDRFGARSGLDLSNISERLNLVYGPNGSGKTTVIQFIRWMMYGQCDELSRPYLSNADGTHGSMTIVDGYGSRTLRRSCQPGSVVGHVVTDAHGAVQSSSTAVVSNTEFDRFFLVNFDLSGRTVQVSSTVSLINGSSLTAVSVPNWRPHSGQCVANP